MNDGRKSESDHTCSGDPAAGTSSRWVRPGEDEMPRSDIRPRRRIVAAEAGTTQQEDLAQAAGGPHICFESQRNGRPAYPTGPQGCEPEAQEVSPQQRELAAQMGYQLAALGIAKSFHKGGMEIPVLRGMNVCARQGEFLAIVGQSGSGKSTLLHLLATLDAPDAGEIHFNGHRIDNLPTTGRDALRNRHFGMIFQFYHLLPELTTLENVLAPLMIAHGALSYFRTRRRHREAAKALLETVGLGHRLRHKPRELSGGEMQRAAIARALIAEPDLLLADEPTGNLDHATGQEIMNTLADLNVRQKLTIVMVTHDQAIADRADRVVRLVDGRIEG